ncbi:MAG: 4Fe-4S dicluster domain-containing protein [Chloroflexia bacterium]|nr:4Fe-4S dicluster domain-containing protein [Chloroflexia bacterium]
MELTVLKLDLSERSFAEQIQKQLQVDVRECYQCGRCTAGCPVAYAMDAAPHLIMRGIQLEQLDWVLARNTYWICASCITCSTRCPCEVDIARVMDGLREIALARDIQPSERTVKVFHQVFLQLVRLTGRMYEAGLVGLYNLRSGHLLDSADLALPMITKGKISPIPKRFAGQDEVERIFERVAALEEE